MPKTTMKIRLFITCLSIFLIPLLLLGVVGGIWASKTVSRNAEASSNAVLINVADRIDNGIDALKNIANLYSSDPLIRRLAYMQGNEIDYDRIYAADLHEYKTSLLINSANSQLHNDIALIFPRKNAVISTLGLWNLDWFFQDEFHIESMTMQDWMRVLEHSGEVLLQYTNMSSFGKPESGIAFVKSALKSNNGDALLNVLFWIDETSLQTQFADLLLLPRTMASIHDENGNLIYSLHSHDNKTTSEHALMDWEKNVAARDYQTLEYVSHKSNWRYTLMVPYDEILSDVHTLHNTIAVILIAMFLVGCLLSYELAQLNYKPLAKIVKTVVTTFSFGEYKQLNSSLEIESLLISVLEKKDELSNSISTNKEMLQYAVLSHLLDGEGTNDQRQYREMLTMLGIDFLYPKFRVCVFNKKENASVNYLRSESTANTLAYMLKASGVQVAIVNYNDSPDSFVRGFGEAGLGLFFSAEHASVFDLSQAFDEAMLLRKLCPISVDFAVYFDEYPSVHKVPVFTLPVEKQLLDHIRSGNGHAAWEFVEKMLEELSDKLSFDLVTRIVVAVDEIILKSDDSQAFRTEILSGIQQPMGDRVEDYIQYIQNMIFLASEYHESRAKEKQEKFMNDLTLFIDDHLCDSQLSLLYTAEAFGVSTAFLSKYFKKHMNIGYLEYVNRKRIDMAKCMLAEKDKSIKQIAFECGFLNDTTFRRLFKKYAGYVPSKTHENEQ